MFDMRKIQQEVIYKAIEKRSDASTAREVVYENAEAMDDSKWVNGAMKKLEDKFDGDTVKRIRMDCQCGYGMDEKIELVKELKNSASSMEEFALNDKARNAGLLYKNGELYLRFEFCPCPMLARVERLESKTWCHCSAGYSKVLFEKAFGCEVDVELLKSVKAGDDECLMKITPLSDVFKDRD